MPIFAGPWKGRNARRRRSAGPWRATLLACTIASANAWAQHDEEPAAPDPGSIVHLEAGDLAPSAGELVAADGLARILTTIDDLERKLALTQRARDEAIRLAEERRARETDILQAAVARQQETNRTLIASLRPEPPFWRRPEFLLGAGIVTGILGASLSFRLASWP